MLYVLDPTDTARTARGKRVRIEEREDGSLSFWHGAHELLATAFPKEHAVRQGEVVESKRLAATIELIKERQRARIDAEVAKPTTILRRARLLRAFLAWARELDPKLAPEEAPALATRAADGWTAISERLAAASAEEAPKAPFAEAAALARQVADVEQTLFERLAAQAG